MRPALYDDVLEIRTRVASMGGARLSFDYEVVRDGTQESLATGSTTHAFVDPEGRPRRLPAEIRSLLQ
jgi:acyl-CoA thioester hydrolase